MPWTRDRLKKSVCVKPKFVDIRPGATFYYSSVKHKHGCNMGTLQAKWQHIHTNVYSFFPFGAFT